MSHTTEHQKQVNDNIFSIIEGVQCKSTETFAVFYNLVDVVKNILCLL
jgi:hypothetical protein